MKTPGMIKKNRNGFTLVELTLAIGVMSFALVAILGLMPVGLKTSQDAILDTTKAQILQKVTTDLSMISFGEELDEYITKEHYFDYEGKMVDSAEDGIFVMEVVDNEVKSPQFPGVEEVSEMEERLGRVLVSIQRNVPERPEIARLGIPVVNFRFSGAGGGN